MEPGGATPAPPTLTARVRTFGGQSLAYTVIGALGRNVAIVLVPLYARALTAEEYGSLGLALTINALLLILLGLGLQAAIQRLTFELDGPRAQGQLYATLLVFVAAAPALICLGLEALGSAGALDLPNLPYDPLGRITLWASYLGLFQALPQTIYVARGQAKKVVLLSLFTAASVVAPTVILVGFADEGVEGALYGLLIGAALSAAVSILLVLRMAQWPPSRVLLVQSLAFALPLVPHSVSQWGLNLADRFVVNHYVAPAELGRYVLGYQIGSLGAIATLAISQALSPAVTGHLKDERTRADVPRLGTYALAGMVAVCTLVAATADDATRIIAGTGYTKAGTVAAVVSLALVFQAVYYVVSQGTWYSMRTRLVPLITAFSVAVVLGLDLWLVPRHGIVAAAASLAVGFALMALLQGLLAHRQYPISWELGRWLRIAAAAGAAYAAAALLGPAPGVAGLVVDTALVLTILPAALTLLGFWDEVERRRLRAWRARRAR